MAEATGCMLSSLREEDKVAWIGSSQLRGSSWLGLIAARGGLTAEHWAKDHNERLDEV